MMLSFSSVNFSKNQKNWSFSPPRPLGHFLRISLFGSFFIQMSEFWYFTCPNVKIWCFPSVLKTFRKIEKIEVFPHPGPRDIFCAFHSLAPFSSKWVNFDILVVLKWKCDAFLQFCKLFEKSKKLKFFPTPALGTFFTHFTLWLLFHPNEWILIFYYFHIRTTKISKFTHLDEKGAKEWNAQKMSLGPGWGKTSIFLIFRKVF